MEVRSLPGAPSESTRFKLKIPPILAVFWYANLACETDPFGDIELSIDYSDNRGEYEIYFDIYLATQKTRHDGTAQSCHCFRVSIKNNLERSSKWDSESGSRTVVAKSQRKPNAQEIVYRSTQYDRWVEIKAIIRMWLPTQTRRLAAPPLMERVQKINANVSI